MWWRALGLGSSAPDPLPALRAGRCVFPASACLLLAGRLGRLGAEYPLTLSFLAASCKLELPCSAS